MKFHVDCGRASVRRLRILGSPSIRESLKLVAQLQVELDTYNVDCESISKTVEDFEVTIHPRASYAFGAVTR